MSITQYLHKRLSLLGLAILLTLVSLTSVQAQIKATASLALTTLGAGSNTYTVTITPTGVDSGDTLTSIQIGAAISTTNTVANLFPPAIRPTAVTMVTPATGWTAARQTDASNYHSILLTAKTPLTVNPQLPIQFTFQSTAPVSAFQAYTAQTTVPAATWVTSSLITDTFSPAPASAPFTSVSSFRALPPLVLNFKLSANAIAQGVSLSNVYVSFESTLPQNFSANYFTSTSGPATAVPPMTEAGPVAAPISLAACNSVIYLGSIKSGIIYLSIGSPLPAGKSPSPALNAGSTQLWTAGCEIDYMGNPADDGDTTVINAYSFPVSVDVVTASSLMAQSSGFISGTRTLDVFQDILGLTTSPDLNLGFYVPAQKKNGPPPGNPQLLRVLTPGQLTPYLNVAGTTYIYPVNGYPTFSNYVASLYSPIAPVITKLEGSFTSAGGTAYTYTFKLTVGPDSTITMKGTYTSGGGVQIGPFVYTLPPDNPALGTYPQSWFLYTSPDNISVPSPLLLTSWPAKYPGGVDETCLAQILHDMEAGFTLGFIGSTVNDPITNKPFKSESSAQWFASEKKVPQPTKYKYAGLQKSAPFYNQYSQLVDSLSNGSIYGAAYSDAIPGVALNTVVIPTATISTPVQGWSITVGEKPKPLTPFLRQKIDLTAIPMGTTPIPVVDTTLAPVYNTAYTLPYYGTIESTGTPSPIPIRWTAPVGSTLVANGTTSYTITFSKITATHHLVGTLGGSLSSTAGTPNYAAGTTLDMPFSVLPIVNVTPSTPQTVLNGGTLSLSYTTIPANLPSPPVVTYGFSASGANPGGATVSGNILTFTATGTGNGYVTVSLGGLPATGLSGLITISAPPKPKITFAPVITPVYLGSPVTLSCTVSPTPVVAPTITYGLPNSQPPNPGSANLILIAPASATFVPLVVGNVKVRATYAIPGGGTSTQDITIPIAAPTITLTITPSTTPVVGGTFTMGYTANPPFPKGAKVTATYGFAPLPPQYTQGSASTSGTGNKVMTALTAGYVNVQGTFQVNGATVQATQLVQINPAP